MVEGSSSVHSQSGNREQDRKWPEKACFLLPPSSCKALSPEVSRTSSNSTLNIQNMNPWGALHTHYHNRGDSLSADGTAYNMVTDGCPFPGGDPGLS